MLWASEKKAEEKTWPLNSFFKNVKGVMNRCILFPTAKNAILAFVLWVLQVYNFCIFLQVEDDDRIPFTGISGAILL